MNEFIGYDIIDRINDLAVRKFGYPAKFSIAMGKAKCWWSRKMYYSNCLRPPLILECAKVLDVNVEYILTGKKMTSYIPCEVSYDKLIDTYKQIAKKHAIEKSGERVSKRTAAFISNTKNRCTGLTISTLFEVANDLKIEPYKLIFKEL